MRDRTCSAENNSVVLRALVDLLVYVSVHAFKTAQCIYVNALVKCVSFVCLPVSALSKKAAEQRYAVRVALACA